MNNIDFSKGVKGKYAKMDLRVVGEKQENLPISWAICVTSSEKNLIPLKMYEIKFHQNSSEVEVIDESAKRTIYPQDYFLSVKLLENEVEFLNEFSLSI